MADRRDLTLQDLLLGSTSHSLLEILERLSVLPNRSSSQHTLRMRVTRGLDGPAPAKRNPTPPVTDDEVINEAHAHDVSGL